MDSIEKLTRMFEKFPGIGPRQARRFVQHLLSERQAIRQELAHSIQELAKETAQCKECFRWFVKNLPAQASSDESRRCLICTSTKRDRGTLFVVEKDVEIENIERSGYKGLYFCLGGVIPLAAEETPKYVRLRELVARINEDGTKKILKELILGLSATAEGDHTRLLLQEKILPIAQGFNFKISSLGRGLSTGSELEYADPDTIASALSSRQ